jgi:acyl-CoA reductase-like NAD-dependent aldehyde dehydrogenase
VPILSWSTEDEVIQRVNSTDFGLGASVWSSDLDRAACLARRIDSGSVWINSHLEMEPTAPFGGHKQSGIGCEGGLDGLRSMCNVQTMFLKKSRF